MSADRRGPSCPSVEDLSALLDGELRGEEAATLRRHVDGCADCAALARRLDTASRMVRALPREEASPERVREVARRAAEARPARASRWLGWAAAATILVGSLVMFRLAQVVAPQVAMVQERPARVLSDKKSKADASPMPGAADATAAPSVAAAGAPEPGAEPAAPAVSLDGQFSDEGMAQAERAVPPSTGTTPGVLAGTTFGEDSESAAKLAKDDLSTGSSVGSVIDSRVGARDRDDAVADVIARDAAESRARANAELAAASAAQSSRRAAAAEETKRQKAEAMPPPPPREQPSATASGPLEAGRRESDAPAAAAPSFDENESAGPARTCTGRERLAPEERPLTLTPAMRAPVLLERVAPAWPAGPPPAGITWRVIIEADGRVTPCGAPAGVSAATDAAARGALARWRFRPAQLEGRPQATWADLDPR